MRVSYLMLVDSFTPCIPPILWSPPSSVFSFFCGVASSIGHSLVPAHQRFLSASPLTLPPLYRSRFGAPYLIYGVSQLSPWANVLRPFVAYIMPCVGG